MKKTIFLIFTVIILSGILAISGCDKNATCIVTFNANGGIGTMDAQRFIEGKSQALTRNAFTYDGYTFGGWNTMQDGGGDSYTDGQSIIITSDIILYAQWTSNGTTSANGVTVTFDPNGGTGEMSPQTFPKGRYQSLTANSFTRVGHEFIGWNILQDGTGPAYSDGQEIGILKNITLYAQWMPYTGQRAGHCYVDLGLPSRTKWATCNIGANSPVDYGDYFAWGETTTKDVYNWSTYLWCEGSDRTLTKYCCDPAYGYNGFTDDLISLVSSDDVAKVNWESNWYIPREADFQELIDNCTATWILLNGVVGRLFTGPNGNSIFLPAAGDYWENWGGRGCGYYWSKSLCTDGPWVANGLLFDSDDLCYIQYRSRFLGCSVRAVCPDQYW